MKKLILSLLIAWLAQFQLHAQSLTTPSWKWGKNFNTQSTKPPLMCYKDGYVYTAGDYDSTLQIESTIFPVIGGTDVYFAKWDTAGNLIWANVISYNGTQRVAGIQVMDNEIILAGSFDSIGLQIGSSIINSIGGQDIFIAKYDTSGNSTALYGYGNTGNDNIRSLCVDYNHDIYVGGDSLYKFSNSGLKLWGTSDIAVHLYYSSVDSTIVFDRNGGTGFINLPGNGPNEYINYVEIIKISIIGLIIWSKVDTITHIGWGAISSYPYESTINESNGDYFLGYSYQNLINSSGAAYNYFRLKKITKTGVVILIPLPDSVTFINTNQLTNVSSNNDFVMYTIHSNNPYGGSYTKILNYITDISFKKYYYLPQKSKSYIFIDTNLIFAHGNNEITNYTFGRFGKDTMTITSNDDLKACLGSYLNLYPSVIGGTPPFTYSWMPTTGLTSSNTLYTSLIVNSNITYTLTVTDSNNSVSTKTFEIEVDTLLTNLNIISQTIVPCDSFLLSTNQGFWGGSWWKLEYGSSGIYWQLVSNNQNAEINTSGMYSYQIINSCYDFNKFIDTIIVTIANSYSTSNLSICSNQLPYTWNGQSLTTNGTYTHQTTNAVGCDSMATLNFTVNQTTSSSSSMAVCSNQLPYTWNGQSLTTSGIYTHQTTNAAGCDSIVTLNFLVNQPTSSSNSMAVCSNQLPYTWNGQSLTTSGTYTHQTTNAAGCDSIATLNFTVNQTTSSSSSMAVCSNQLPYTWNGQNFTTSGTYTHQTINAAGCDSIATLNFTVNQTTSSSSALAVCSNQLPYTWNGQSLTTSGIYTYQTTNAAGCDSISTLNFTVTQPTSSSSSMAVCSNQLPYTWNGQSLTTSGIYTHQTTNAAGCDSIATLNFTLYQTSSSSSVLSIDPNLLPFTWNGQTISNGGIYSQTFIDINGCDSIVTIDISISPLSINPMVNVEGGHIFLYPNPTSNTITLAYSLTESSSISIQLFDVAGKLITEIAKQEMQNKGKHLKEINLRKLGISSGTYFLQVNDGIRNWNERIVYQE